MSRLVRTAALVTQAFLIVVPAFAQGGASLLTGTVKDVNGGVLPGVTVKVTNVTTNTSYRSTFPSSATASTYLIVDGDAPLNARFGFRAAESGRCRSGRATCSAGTTATCSRRRPATPDSTSGSPVIRAPSA
jgi:hypothetical protein